jgi:hypothetical protein
LNFCIIGKTIWPPWQPSLFRSVHDKSADVVRIISKFMRSVGHVEGKVAFKFRYYLKTVWPPRQPSLFRSVCNKSADVVRIISKFMLCVGRVQGKVAFEFRHYQKNNMAAMAAIFISVGTW